MKHIILPLVRLATNAVPEDELLSQLAMCLKESGYSDAGIGVQVNNGWHPVSEKPKEDGQYFVAFKGRVWITRYNADTGWRTGWNITHWQPIPEPELPEPPDKETQP